MRGSNDLTLKPEKCMPGEPDGTLSGAGDPVVAGGTETPEPRIPVEHEKWMEKITRLIDFF